MNELEKCAAEILVECGYAETITEVEGIVIVKYGELQIYPETIDPYYSGDNTHRECISRRQADAVEDWLFNRYKELWTESVLHCGDGRKDLHLWRLDRIKWCIQELINEEIQA